MQLVYLTTFLLATTYLPAIYSQNHALFINKDAIESGKRVARQTSADQMVQNILQWLQGVYTQNSRKIRQGSLREYLPPTNTQKPRPFQTTPPYNIGDNDINGGYSPSGSANPQPPFTGVGETYPSLHPEISPPVDHPNFNGYPHPTRPQPPFTITTGRPGTGYPSDGRPSTSFPLPPGTTYIGPNTGYPNTGYPSPGTKYPSFPSPSTGYPGPTTGYPSGSPGPTTGYPGSGPTTRYPGPGPVTGYPGPGPTTGYPGPGPTTGYPGPGPTTGYPGPTTGYPNPSTGYPGPGTGYPSPTTAYPSSSTNTGYPGPSTGYPGPGTGYPGPGTGYPGPSTGYPGPSTGYPGPSTGYPGPSTDYPGTESPTVNTGYPSPTTDYPEVVTNYPTQPTGPPVTSRPTNIPDTQPPYTNGPSFTTTPADEQTPDVGLLTTTPNVPSSTSPPDDDGNHPPHIHAIDVECSKDMMTITIEFNRQFDGIIYSKGHYNSPECRYVQENSGQTKYTFTVSLNSCGTEFVNAFDTQGKSYLENVLVLQNEAGIQEVWDTIRSVRCLWEGNLKKMLNVALSVGMLNQEIVTFSGDTAMARLDIQQGKGPFAPPANGLVKIGEVMTLVVSVTGDPGFDIQVKDCRAKDSSGENVVDLTDDQGCILKPKLFGAFQKTRSTGNTGASIIAYAFFNAFKFPDVMDLSLECNVDLCKTDCAMCPEGNQKIDPGRRRRRDLYSQNYTNTEDNSVTIKKMLRVIVPEDLGDVNALVSLNQNVGICMSTEGFILSSSLLISLLVSSCLFSTYIWLKYQRLSYKK